MTAREQLLRAKELGHELYIVTAVNEAFPDALPKYRLKCSCGYSSTARRSRAAVNSTMVMHLGKVIAGNDHAPQADRRRNGLAG